MTRIPVRDLLPTDEIAKVGLHELARYNSDEREYRAFIFNALRDAGVTTKSGAIEIAFHSSLDAPHRWSIELFTRARMISETIDDYLITVDMKEADNG